MKKKTLAALAVSLAAASLWSVTSLAAPVDTGFTDVDPTAWYAEAVAYVKNQGLMGGSGDTFSPNASTTRAQLTAILYRAAGSPEAEGGTHFTDVAEDAYYAGAVNWAVGLGIIGGYGDGSFGSNDPITRQQLATILWRYAGSPPASGVSDFEDAEDIAGYAGQAVQWASSSRIINGNGGKFLPKETATRAQLAVILKNYMELAEPAVELFGVEE